MPVIRERQDQTGHAEVVKQLKEQICQILREEYPHWLYHKTIAIELDKRFPVPKNLWERLHGLITLPLLMRKQWNRELSRVLALKELLSEGKIITSEGAFKLADQQKEEGKDG